MELIWTVVVGLIIGAMAKLLMPGKDPGGLIITMILGIAGSTLAYAAGRGLGWYAPGTAPGFVASVVGAMALLALYRLARRPR
jgi:uncharacterized membrane protein YeaQ/YmgE (transglycosylase-associated protein family)